MGLILEIPFFCEALLGILLLFLMLYLSVTKNFSYWEERKVPHLNPSFPFGNTGNFFLGKQPLGEMHDEFYRKFKGERFFGIYDMHRPVFVVRDPQLIKHILTKDFHHFQNRFNMAKFINPKIDYMFKHLFNLGGQEWKNMRQKLSPTFTSGKLKMMFQIMEKCGQQLGDHVKVLTKKDAVVDVKDVLARFTLDMIATCAFGLETNSLEDPNCEFYLHGLQIFHASLYRRMRRILFVILPSLTKRTNFRFMPKELTEFFTRIIRETVEYREKNNVTRNDFLNLLIQVGHNQNLNGKEEINGMSIENQTKDKKENEGLTIEEITAQAFVFFAAGFETASSTMSFCLYELAQHPEIQDKLYLEIKDVLDKHGGKPTYQAFQEMPYMEKVINETLRLYASLSILNRVCTEQYKVPDSDLVLEKGVNVVVPTYALHHDSLYYDEPFKFDPERFSPEKVRERDPYVHLPFGEGPRICIGMRFGLLQTKIGLTHMLLNFEFGVTPKTQIPVSLNKTSFVTQPEEPILLKLTRRTPDISS